MLEFGKHSDYQILEQIGKGTYGSVYKALHSKTAQLCALKRISLLNEKEAVREIKIMTILKHRNVLPILDVVAEEGAHLCASSASFYIVMPYMQLDLSAVVSEHKAMQQLLPLSQTKYYAKQILHALAYLHANQVMHRDIKTSNVLISARGEVCLADFGLARFKDVRCSLYTNRVVTLWYRAPELLLGTEEYDESIDCWALGCVLAELLTGEPLFPGQTELDMLNRIFFVCGTPTLHEWPGVTSMPWFDSLMPKKPHTRAFDSVFRQLDPDARNLLASLLEPNPHKRVSAADALLHPFFSNSPHAISAQEHPRYSEAHDMKARKRKDQQIRRSTKPLIHEKTKKSVQSREVQLSPVSVDLDLSKSRRSRSRSRSRSRQRHSSPPDCQRRSAETNSRSLSRSPTRKRSRSRSRSPTHSHYHKRHRNSQHRRLHYHKSSYRQKKSKWSSTYH